VSNTFSATGFGNVFCYKTHQVITWADRGWIGLREYQELEAERDALAERVRRYEAFVAADEEYQRVRYQYLGIIETEGTYMPIGHPLREAAAAKSIAKRAAIDAQEDA
jgi:hypothetical protein